MYIHKCTSQADVVLTVGASSQGLKVFGQDQERPVYFVMKAGRRKHAGPPRPDLLKAWFDPKDTLVLPQRIVAYLATRFHLPLPPSLAQLTQDWTSHARWAHLLGHMSTPLMQWPYTPMSSPPPSAM